MSYYIMYSLLTVFGIILKAEHQVSALKTFWVFQISCLAKFRETRLYANIS